MTPIERKTLLEKKLHELLVPSYLDIIDESHLHAGHIGAQSGASHFAIKISASSLEGLSKVKQHQKIYQAVGNLIPNEIHALRIVIV